MRCYASYWWKMNLYIVMPLMRFGSLQTLLEKVTKYRKNVVIDEAVWKHIAYALFKGLDDLNRWGSSGHYELKSGWVDVHFGTMMFWHRYVLAPYVLALYVLAL